MPSGRKKGASDICHPLDILQKNYVECKIAGTDCVIPLTQDTRKSKLVYGDRKQIHAWRRWREEGEEAWEDGIPRGTREPLWGVGMFTIWVVVMVSRPSVF